MFSNRLGRRCLLFLVLPALLAPGGASGQETALAIEFNFSNPGARSMGLGGAFAALADDATAAFANPAGLVQLVDPEVSAEARLWSYSTPFVEGGRISGEPSGVGIDTTAGLRIAESSQDTSGLSFLSLVYPRGRWSLAVYRHQLANFEFMSETQGLIRSVPEAGPDALERFAELRSITDFEIVSHGLAAAYRVGERLSFGLGLAHVDVELQAPSETYNAPNFVDPNPYLPEDLRAVNVLAIDGQDWVWSAGWLWQMAERWQLGGFFRQGAELAITNVSRTGPADPPPGRLRFILASPIAMPDVYGLGLSFGSRGGALTVGFEWDRVAYATIVDSLDETTFPLLPEIDDAGELHLGAEYALLRSTPLVAFRAGVWLDPDHRLRANEAEEDLFIRAVRQRGDDELHFTAGLGIAFKTIQVDLAVDFSDLVDTASISAIYSF